MREINFLTWNTQLYEMGNSINDEQPVKKIDMLTFNIVVKKVKKFLDSKNEAVAILQEIPFKCNIDGFKEHKLNDFHKYMFVVFTGQQTCVMVT